MRLQKFLVFIIILFVSDCGNSQNSFRLPNNTKPLRYDLWLKVNVEEGLTPFFGRVKIHGEVLQTSETITLHSKNIFVKEINLLDRNGTLIKPNMLFYYDIAKTFLTIVLESEMSQGSEFVLDISYKGSLTRSDMATIGGDRGFALDKYVDIDNNTVNYISTHFEPVYARECLPCYDEPAIRAIFNVKIEHDESYEALSNMPVVSRDKMNDAKLVTTSFQDTPPMQSYLLAFFIHKFTFTHTNNLRMPQQIFTRPALSDNRHVKFAIENLDKILRVFEEEFELPYSLPKLDHVVAPSFRSAIENWGLIGYGEYYIKTDSELTSIKVFLHEIAHNYFGNLLSPKWWDYAWLNEGFAKFYEMEIAKIVFPDKMVEIDEVIFNSMSRAFFDDANMDVHPALNEMAATVEEIENKFRSLTYTKGSAIVRMFKEVLGSRTWRKGIRKYLKAHQFSAVEPNDLYAALQEAIDEDQDYRERIFNIAELMSTWVDQPNYPIVTVNKTGNKVMVSQNAVNGHSEIYAIPITYTTSNHPDFEDKSTRFFLTTKSIHQIQSNASWIILNLQQVGLYSVKYDNNLIDEITEQFIRNHTVIHRTNRLWFLVALQSSFVNEEVRVNQILKLLSYFKHETNSLVIQAGFRTIQSIILRLSSSKDENFENLRIYLKDAIAKFYQLMPNIPYVKAVACHFEDEQCVGDTLNRQYLEMTENAGKVNRKLNYCALLTIANATTFDYFFDLFISLPANEGTTDLLLGLRCTQREDSYLKILNVMLDQTKSEEIRKVIGLLTVAQMNSRRKVRAFFTFLNENFDALMEKSRDLIVSVIDTVIPVLSSKEDCDKILIFQRKLSDDYGIETSTCKPKISNFNKYQQEVADFFSANTL